MTNLDDLVTRNNNTAHRVLDGEGLIMNPADSMLHSLNDVATVIWGFLAGPQKIRDIINRVMLEFDCDMETAERDVIDFLLAMQKQGLVEILKNEP
jgi:hypothetical protein